jgi:hypothetical protein
MDDLQSPTENVKTCVNEIRQAVKNEITKHAVEVTV